MNNNKKYWFAKPLSNAEKFFACLKVCSDKFKKSGLNEYNILMALCHQSFEENNSYQKIALFGFYHGEDVAFDIQNYFLDRYNNEDELIKYLNKKITYRNIRNPTTKDTQEEKDKVISSVKNIINNHFEHLISDDIF